MKKGKKKVEVQLNGDVLDFVKAVSKLVKHSESTVIEVLLAAYLLREERREGKAK